METGIIRKVLIAVMAVLAVMSVSYFVGRTDGRIKAQEDFGERGDTIVIRKTITSYKPNTEERRRLPNVYIPVMLPDTIWMHDTLYVYMEKEQVVWEDSLSRVYASGINPQIDSVQHFVQERLITREIYVPQIKKTRWGVGIQAGYGSMMVNGRAYISPYVGIGVSYNIIRW